MTVFASPTSELLQVYAGADTTHYFACHILRFVTLSALGVQDEVRYQVDFQRRLVEFITTLTNGGDERRRYEIRIISEPDAKVSARGRMSVFLLGRLDGCSPVLANRYALEFHRMFSSSFPEYESELVKSDEVAGVLTPFPATYVVELARRVGREPLNTLRPRFRQHRNLGFSLNELPEPDKTQSGDDGAIVHLFPFVPTGAPFNNLFRLLLLEPNPISISLRLQPTKLSQAEGDYLERVIVECERHSQVSLGGSSVDDLSTLHPTLREKATAQQHHLSRLLFGLRNSAALMTIHIASTSTISSFVPEMVGGLITQPAGGSKATLSNGIAEYLAGGYEVIVPEKLSGAVAALGDLGMTLPVNPLMPGGAERIPYLFDSVEATAAFRLPSISNDELMGVNTRSWRSAPPPRDLPETGVLLGESNEPGTSREVRISPEDRLRHTYLVGQTGTGKSTMLRTMILDDIRAGEGVCVLDPHGDLYKDLLGRIPADRMDDVILVDPTDLDYPVGINLLEYSSETERFFIIQELTAIITRTMMDSFGDAAMNMMGPIFFQHLRMNLFLAMSDPEHPSTLMDFYQIFQESGFWRRWLPLRSSDPLLDQWVTNVLPEMDYLRQGSEGASMGGWVSSKFESFLFDPMLRNIFGQKQSTIRFREAMDTGKILLVNLAKGSLTEPNSRFFGMIVLAQLQAAALGRVNIPEAERRPFYLYVDEFQSVATEGFITMLSEARKFGLGLVLANQFVSQIKNDKIMASILGNAGSLVCFRLGETDAELMEKEMSPTISRHDLLNIPNWHAYISTLAHNQTVRPFEIRTVKEQGTRDEARALEVKARSRRNYGRDREAVTESLIRRKAEPEETRIA